MNNKYDEFDWRYSDYIIDSIEDKVIIKIAIGPIKRNRYYFYIFKRNDNYYIKMSYESNEEHWKIIQESCKENKIDLPMIEAINETLGSKVFSDICSKYFKVYDLKVDKKYTKEAIEEILNLDYTIPYSDILGLDGFSIYMNLPDLNINYYSWCLNERPNHYRIVEFINYLLECVSIYKTNPIEISYDILENKIKQKNKKLVDNKILLDRDRLLKQFDMKFEDCKYYNEMTIRNYKKILEELSEKKILKINYNLRKSMLDKVDRTENIINYVLNQVETDDYNPFSWCEFEDVYKNIYNKL